ncbi:hypothetical protein [Dysgonomonas sp. 521]|uniref:hypothetical protein n=1 Tax=Dysgonomonas sp. 521 TaxID=2302932 RepID=UPI0013D3ABE0|nr:hypothetical protein [Dysgonomonas sp. 521]
MKILFSLYLLLSLAINIMATGPSYTHAGIRPIAINDKGEVLCRTRFIQNPMGGHYYQDIEYGVCVLTADTIIYSRMNILMQEGFPSDAEREAQYNYWESVYNSPYDAEQLSSVEYAITYKKDFRKIDVSTYLRNDTISLSNFKSKYNVDLRTTPQYSLYGGKGFFEKGGRECYDENLEPSTAYAVLEYDFGNILLINNEVNDFSCYGAAFDYVNMFGGEDIGYEYFRVTGVVFRKE